MSDDGAHLGVDAERALKTILAGAEQPTADERKSRAAVRARVMAAPGPDANVKPAGYGQAADMIAKAGLVLLAELPAEKRAAFLAPPRSEGAVDLYDAITHRWPDFDKQIGGATGFMVGWAINCIRWLHEQPPIANPAIITIE